MERDILSLRNIYRFLMVNDYPIYSSGIFTEENRKGLTLTKFWQENLIYEFISGYYGKKIWRTAGGRNRHLSEMCNRSQVLKWYPQYTEELVSCINTKTLLQQISQFVTCLRERKYDANIFEKKVEAVIQRILKQDEYCNEEVVDFFQRNLQDYQDSFEIDTETRLFFAGWMLTFLSIHAMSGEQMTAPAMQKLDRNSSFSFKALWEARQDVGNRKADEVHFLTNLNNALCITPLPMMRFFGRERELFDLRELLEKGGCYLLSGMGGIGKTELLRQFLRLCTEQGLVDEIAVIQYEGNLADSCLNAFPNVRGENREGILQEALARIRIREDKRVLTLVDNVNNTLEEDPALAKLCTLPGTVLLTSRLAEMEGFVTYNIKAPGKETGMLIYRDNYGKALPTEDREQLEELLEQEIWCHTLTLRLLGNIARVKSWTIKQLKEKLSQGGRQLLKPRENREISLVEMYRRLYDLSGLTKEQIAFLRCFATLPFQYYSQAFVNEFLGNCFTDADSMKLQLTKLQEYGWVNVSPEGYHMHPVIAECVLSKEVQEEDVDAFLTAIEARWSSWIIEDDCLKSWYLYAHAAEEEDCFLVSILLYSFHCLSGNFSPRLQRLVIMAGIHKNSGEYSGIESKNAILKKLWNQKHDMTDELQFWLDILLMSGDFGEREAYYKELWDSQRRMEFPEWLQGVFGTVYAELMISVGKIQETEKTLSELRKLELLPFSQVAIEHVQAFCFMYQTRFVEAKEQYTKVIDRAREIGFPNTWEFQQFYFAKIIMSIELGDFEEAQRDLSQLQVLVAEKKHMIGGDLVAQCKAVLARHRGELEAACEYQLESIKTCKYICGEGADYAARYCELGTIQGRQERYEEAKESYLKGISILLSHHRLESQTHRAYTSLGDLYIRWNKPKEALECLIEAQKFEEVVTGSVGRGEVQRNYARAYRLLGDLQKEKEHLLLAVPMLEEGYGPDHERTVEMRERLKEVEKLL